MMLPSHFETLPCDVLQRIGFHCSISSVIDGSRTLRNLLLTSRRIHDVLSLSALPGMYAEVFTVLFDVAAPRRRFPSLTSACVGAELVHRIQVLRRIRLGEISDQHILTDLWTIYLMLMENDHLNEMQLSASNAYDFIVMCIKKFLRHGIEKTFEETQLNQIRSLSLWSFWLLATYAQVRDESLTPRRDLINVIRRFAVSSLPGNGSTPTTPISFMGAGHFAEWPCTVHHFSRALCLACPDLSAAAILAILVLKEVVPYAAPPGLPANRAAAQAMNWVGPSMEDWTAMTKCITPLLAEASLVKGIDVSRSILQDNDYHRLIYVNNRQGQPFTYTPGTFSGSWEGSMMTSSGTELSVWMPLQCTLTEHVYFHPNVPIGTSAGLSADNDASLDWNISPSNLVRSEDAFEIHHSHEVHQFRYHTLPSGTSSQGESPGETHKALDVILKGETQLEHGIAWGAYSFFGRVRLRDGFVVLIRGPKYGADIDHPWIFEGYLYSGLSFVGRWRSSRMFEQQPLGGSFSLSKRTPSGNGAIKIGGGGDV